MPHRLRHQHGTHKLVLLLLAAALFLVLCAGCGARADNPRPDENRPAAENTAAGASSAGETAQPGLLPAPTETAAPLDENGSYTSKEDVALYISLFGKLPQNFITKQEARALGWSGGSVELYAPGKCIGGDRFGNFEKLLPEKDGRTYKECDIDTLGAPNRGAKRLVYSNDGLIYYTEDHYESFELWAGGGQA